MSAWWLVFPSCGFLAFYAYPRPCCDLALLDSSGVPGDFRVPQVRMTFETVDAAEVTCPEEGTIIFW